VADLPTDGLSRTRARYGQAVSAPAEPPFNPDLDPDLEADADLLEAERLEREAARRSLRARLTGGPVLRAIGKVDTIGMRWVRGQARSRRVTAVVRSYSHLGEHGAAWVAIGTIGALVDGPRRRQWLTGLGGVGVAYVANTSLKQVARRKRPDFPDLPPLIPTPGPLSFPSSHSASSAAAYVGYAGLLPAAPLAIAASTMAVSRVHLGVHYPTDIAVGATLGFFVARGVRRVAARY
jgi:hypothetical protein